MVERSGIDPADDRAGRRRLHQPGRPAGVQHHPHGVADRGPARSRWRARPSTASAARRSRPPAWPRSFVTAGVVDVAAACGVEVMSRVPDGLEPGRRQVRQRRPEVATSPQYEYTTQFEAAERIAEKWGISRARARRVRLRVAASRRGGVGRGSLRHPDRPGRRSRCSARTASPPARPPRSPATRACARPPWKAWPRSSRSAREENGVHTAGTVVADLRRRRAVLLMTGARRPTALGLTPRARIVDSCLVGSRPDADAHRPDRRHPAPLRAAPG